MAEALFVTGTDTGIGKTLVASALLVLAARRGLRSLGLKPLASGADATADGLRNPDALALQALASERLPYAEVNPVVLQPAIAPHIAAGDAGVKLDARGLAGACRAVLARPHDLAVIEGAGGWRVPLNARETLADVARLLDCPVVLVVGMRLGCINHALLSAEAIRADGLVLAGWVANALEPDMPRLADNLATLEQRLGAPCLGRVPHLAPVSPEAAADHLRLPA